MRDASQITFRRRAFAQLTPRALHDLLRLRGDVFVVEMGIVEENDIDGLDPDAVHVMGTDPQDVLVATARLSMAESPILVSRVVVAKPWRGIGVGRALMEYVGTCLRSCPAVMSAQAHLEGFYARTGWRREGDVYDEVGIPHLRLVRQGDPGAP